METMEPVKEKKWMTTHLNKSKYAVKQTTKLKTEGEPYILKQEWPITDCNLQD